MEYESLNDLQLSFFPKTQQKQRLWRRRPLPLQKAKSVDRWQKQRLWVRESLLDLVLAHLLESMGFEADLWLPRLVLAQGAWPETGSASLFPHHLLRVKELMEESILAQVKPAAMAMGFPVKAEK
jgi:hypothetical protein